MASLNDLRRERGHAIEEMRRILKTAREGDRDLSAEEKETYDRMEADEERLRDTIGREEKVARLEKDVDTIIEEQAEKNQEAAAAEKRIVPIHSTDEYRDMFENWFYSGQVTPEFRAMQAELDAEGGYAVTPQQLASGIWEKIANEVFIRKYATIFSVPKAESLGIITLETKPALPTKGGEITSAAAESSTALGKRELHPHRMAEYIYISDQLMRQSFTNIGSWITRLFAERFGDKMETDYLTGGGNQESLGLFTADAAGINTDRDYSTGNSTSAIVPDNLVGNVYNVKKGYRRKGRWLFSRSGIRRIRQLVQGEGDYIWQPGLQPGEPDRLLGYPVDESELSPDTWSTGKYVGLFGDWSYYAIADAETFQMKRGDELRMLNFQTVFLGSLFTDGMPIHSEAFSRVTLG